MLFNRIVNLALSAALIFAVAGSIGPGWCGEAATQEQNLALLKRIEADLAKKPNDQLLNLQHAELMGRLHRYDEEVEEASAILKKDPRSRDAYLIQAHGFGMLERSADAIKSLDAAFSLGKPTPDLLVLKATHLRREKRYLEAVKILSKVIEEHPGYSEAYDCRSVCYYRLYGPCKLALSDLEIESRLEPQKQETKDLIKELRKKLATH